ncbi:trehalase-like [Euwallacea fornicatus]|uniref:trehalase-like n=1 Tax=Euwallacea fornicatus TaxID=995702 RepID=UPI00338E4138
MKLQITLLLSIHLYSWISSANTIRPKIHTPTMVGRMNLRQSQEIHSCPSMVYCQGDLLDTVQRQKLFTDSKRFVDMSQRNDESVTLDNFKAMMAATDNQPNRTQIKEFVAKNFEYEAESEKWTPQDYNPEPKFLNNIRDPSIRVFAQELVSFWPQLGRKITNSVKEHPDRHSVIPVPEGFIVPGGRFQEIYYWDSYWIIKGLLISEMSTTVKGMLTNLIYLIQQYGMIPNGSRLYYVNRSQPPVFTMMVGLYLEYTNDLEWLKTNIDYIEAELNFWLSYRTLEISVDNNRYQLAHYGTDSNTPRPESYAEDLDTCASCVTEEERRGCYNALKTAAETGWDFSVRWIFDKEGGTNANLSFTDSQRVIPVDLNAFLCKSFRLLSEFYGKLGNTSKQDEWSVQADQWRKNVEQILYNNEDGIWYDFDYNLSKQRKYFFPSNYAPLWAECYDLSRKTERGSKAVKYFKRNNLEQYRGGIPASLELTGEQWDLPNAWPPLQEFVVLGLYNTGYAEAQEIARNVAKLWINANLIGYNEHAAMFEKYDALTPGQYGGGGEYEVQLGFGWTNGVALSFIDQFYSSGNISKISLNIYIYSVVFSLVAVLTTDIIYLNC